MGNKISNKPSKGFIFLWILSSVIWFMIGLNGNNFNIISTTLISIALGIISAVVLAILFVIMKNWFKW